MQLSLFSEEKNIASIAMEELFQAYIKCRRYKRNTTNALNFEIDYESNLVTLCEEINNGTYNPGKSIAFIVNKPVKRERRTYNTFCAFGKNTIITING